VSRVPTLLAIAGLLGAVACNAITGATDLVEGTQVDASAAPPSTPDGGAGPGDAGSPADAPVEATPPVLSGFAWRRPISLTSDAPATTSGRAVLVVIPSSFDYTHTKPGGDDLRFRSPADPEVDLPYWIEKWNPEGESFVWIRPQVVPSGSSVVFAYYGNENAAPQSSFESTFPNAIVTAGDGNGSFTASEDIVADWFELRAGDTLTLAPRTPLKITAERIIIAGVIEGTGRGYSGGPAPHMDGSGPGAGRTAGMAHGGGGGGYGGAGGRGGSDREGAGGPGGEVVGTSSEDDIAMGSGGASALRPGGDGGGAISLFGWRTTVTGAIRMNGVDGQGGTGQNPGGGAGGGIFIASSFLELAGATLEAKGGAGGPCTNSAADGGGGGGGGRIKLRRRANGAYSAPASVAVDGGARGAGSSTTAPGFPGSPGTVDVKESSTAAKGVETSLGPEEPAG